MVFSFHFLIDFLILLICSGKKNQFFPSFLNLFFNSIFAFFVVVVAIKLNPMVETHRPVCLAKIFNCCFQCTCTTLQFALVFSFHCLLA